MVLTDSIRVKELYKYPSMSIIIPTYNSEKMLKGLLNSIKNQDYPAEKIEILVVDDDSTDNTVNIARDYGAKILRNGAHNIEMGKSIGLRASKNEYVFFIDDDNRLPKKNWLGKCIEAMLINPNCVGAEAIWFRYDKSDSLANRYCSLFGINDPVVFYLGKRDRLMYIERTWKLSGKIIKETKNYYVIEFDEFSLPTIGSQGFLTKKSLLLKTNYYPRFFHMDSNLELVKMGFNKFLMMKLDIIHLHSNNIQHFLKKLKRNIELFHKYKALRKYKYHINILRLFFIFLLMVTILKPFYDCILGYIKKHDIAWFIHVIYCFVVPLMYLYVTFKWKIKSFFDRLV
ncbi:glycosyltransferase family 2 protein [Patescibacteria group bacterium]|nr:glycosyltransferase family 2 protein [Patescibacteria group bacterium]